MQENQIQFCPKCKSKNIRISTLSGLGNPFINQGVFGWECLDCGYIGKDFLIVSKKEYDKLLKENSKNQK